MSDKKSDDMTITQNVINSPHSNVAGRDLTIHNATPDRRLSEEQRQIIKRALQSSPKSDIVIESMSDSPESYRYALDFDEVFRSVGWTSRILPILEMRPGPPSTGLILAVQDESFVTDSIISLHTGIYHAGIKMVGQKPGHGGRPVTLFVAYRP